MAPRHPPADRLGHPDDLEAAIPLALGHVGDLGRASADDRHVPAGVAERRRLAQHAGIRGSRVRDEHHDAAAAHRLTAPPATGRAPGTRPPRPASRIARGRSRGSPTRQAARSAAGRSSTDRIAAARSAGPQRRGDGARDRRGRPASSITGRSGPTTTGVPAAIASQNLFGVDCRWLNETGGSGTSETSADAVHAGSSSGGARGSVKWRPAKRGSPSRAAIAVPPPPEADQHQRGVGDEQDGLRGLVEPEVRARAGPGTRTIRVSGGESELRADEVRACRRRPGSSGPSSGIVRGPRRRLGDPPAAREPVGERLVDRRPAVGGSRPAALAAGVPAAGGVPACRGRCWTRRRRRSRRRRRPGRRPARRAGRAPRAPARWSGCRRRGRGRRARGRGRGWPTSRGPCAARGPSGRSIAPSTARRASRTRAPAHRRVVGGARGAPDAAPPLRARARHAVPARPATSRCARPCRERPARRRRISMSPSHSWSGNPGAATAAISTA